MILWGYVIGFSVFNWKIQLKIVCNVVSVKLKRNFSQAINALLIDDVSIRAATKPSECPPFGRALRRALGFVSARIETSVS